MAKFQGKRELKKNVIFLVEGETEKFYIEGLLKDLNFKLKIRITSMKGGGYKNFLENIYKNKDTYDIIIVVADLDRANTNNADFKNLKSLIELLRKENPCNNIFLTYENIETWIKSSIPNIEKNNLADYLGYTDSSKAKEDIFKRIKNKNGDIEIAKTKFKEENLFFIKKGIERGILNEKNLSKVQSNLMYFDNYLKKIDLL